MSLIRDIAQMLEDHQFGTLNDDLFVEDMPANPGNAIMVLQNISPQPDQYLATRTLNFEIWVRNMSTKTGHDIQDNIFEFLHRLHHVTLGDYYVYFIGATGNVENLDKDIERRSLHKVVYRAIYIDNRTVS